MSVERNRATGLRFQEAMNRHDLDAVAACLAEDFHYHGSDGKGPRAEDRKAYLAYTAGLFHAFPDLSFDMLEVVAEGDLAATRTRMTGTHRGEIKGLPASGRELDLEFANVMRFDSNGLILEHRDYLDALELMRQLGAIPAAAPS